MTSAKPAILIVDDDYLSLEMYFRELSQDFLVHLKCSVSEAIDFIQSTSLSALVIEPAIDEGKGWDLLNHVRKDSSGIPIVLCSVEDERKIGMEQGATIFLVKPVLPTQLRDVLKKILRVDKVNKK